MHKKINRYLHQLAQKFVSKKRYLLSVLVIGIVFLSIPRVPGILKLLSFTEADFQTSTSEALYESTATHPGFQVRIGTRSDTKRYTLALLSGTNSVTFTGVNLVADEPQTAPVSPTPVATPEITVPTPTATTEPQEPAPTMSTLLDATASPSATQTASPHEVQAEQPEPVAPQATEAALPTLRVASESAQEPVSLVTDAVGDVQQSFLGTYEKLVLKGGSYPELTYHYEGAQLIETWKLQKPATQFIFLVTEQGLKAEVTQDNRLILLADTAPQIEIDTELTDAQGARTQIAQTVSDNRLTLTLPADWLADPQRAFPLTLKRSFHSLVVQEISSRELLTTVLPPELVTTAIDIPVSSKFLTAFNDLIIFWNAENHTIYSVIHGAAAPIFTVQAEPVALSCTSETCFFVTESERYTFTPPLKQPETPLALNHEDAQPLSERPIGGYAKTASTAYLTSNTDPNGYLLKKTDASDTLLLENLTFAGEVSVSPDGNTLAVWANGQLYLSENGNSFSKMNLSAKPTALSAANGGVVYAIVQYGDEVQGVLRVTQDQVLALADVQASFTAVLWKDSVLYLSYTQNRKTGYLLLLPLSEVAWKPV